MRNLWPKTSSVSFCGNNGDISVFSNEFILWNTESAVICNFKVSSNNQSFSGFKISSSFKGRLVDSDALFKYLICKLIFFDNFGFLLRISMWKVALFLALIILFCYVNSEHIIIEINSAFFTNETSYEFLVFKWRIEIFDEKIGNYKSKVFLYW